MSKCLIRIAIIMFLLQGAIPLEARNAASDDALAYQAARKGQYDLSWMYYRSLLTPGASPAYREKALFAQGEYFYMNRVFADARQSFEQYLGLPLTIDQQLLALAYLLKLAQLEQNTQRANDIEQKIISLKQQSFIFSNQKEFVVMSPLYRQHKIIYAIDKVEVYVEGKLFATVHYED
jgi:hypothetical protein